MVVSNIFYFHPYLGKIPILANIFQRGWNHQLGGLLCHKPVEGFRFLINLCTKSDVTSFFLWLMYPHVLYETRIWQVYVDPRLGLKALRPDS